MIQFFCVVCLAPKLKLNTSLCGFCQNKVDERVKSFHMRMEGDVPHYYLFSWDKRSKVFCKSLIYFLKNKPEVFFSEWAALLDESFLEVPLILVPSSDPLKGFNHAKSFAESLVKPKSLSCVIEVGLKAFDAVDQKLKSRFERLRSNKVDLSRFAGNKNWIFVDDILVSGGTYKKVLESMRVKPKAIFTLFYKPYLNNKGFYDA